jgi:predicted negative regulator of RcsB-dependent stress response
MRGAMIRLSTVLLQQGDNERAMDIADKCLEVYPNMNFPFDNQTLSLIRVYQQGGDLERGKKHILTLATELVDRMNFYRSLVKPEAVETFRGDRQSVEQAISQLNQLVDLAGSEALKKEVKDILASELTGTNIPN